MKTRSAGALGPRLGEQARRRVVPRNNEKRTIPEGQFDRFFPNEVPLWINLSPCSGYEQEVYDRAEKAVIKVETTWFESQKHYVARNKGRVDKYNKRLETEFICSCGAYQEAPCYGCAIRKNHYDAMDTIQAEKGIRPDKEAPISRMSQFSFAITVAEKILAIPLRDAKGDIRKMKGTNNTIYRYVPYPVASQTMTDSEMAVFTSAYGHKMHWTLGPQDLSVLVEADDKMRNSCGNCADPLFSAAMVCPGCENVTALPEMVSGVDLTQARNKIRNCEHCHERGPFVPVMQCGGCGVAVEGRLTSFDIRITRKKVGDKYLTDILAIRIPGSKNAEDNARFKHLTENPLHLEDIFAPTPLERQKYICGTDLTHGIRPEDAIRRAKGESESNTATEPYSAPEEDDGIPF